MSVTEVNTRNVTPGASWAVRLRMLTAMWVLALFAQPASAGFVDSLRLGLAYAGFDVSAQRDYIGDGIFLRAVTIFPDIPVNAGISEFSLSGPLSLEVYRGGRGLEVTKIRFQTALHHDEVAQPLGYSYSTDVGGQQAIINGTVLVDGGLSFNSLGFYDLQIEYSSRQDVRRAGSIVDDDLTFDSDLGPIHIRGNIIADVLALITSPILGTDAAQNPFVAFSGQDQLAKISAGIDSSMLDALASGRPADTDWRFLPNSATRIPVSGATGVARSVVPEPAVLALMLAGLPMLYWRRRRS